MFYCLLPLVGRGNRGRKEGSSGGSLLGKQLTSKPSEGARCPPSCPGWAMNPRRTPLEQKLGGRGRKSDLDHLPQLVARKAVHAR